MIIKNIAKEIQEALKAKERAFSRKDPAFLEGSENLDPTALDFKDLASRTTFVRMISNKKPGYIRIIQGGELWDVESGNLGEGGNFKTSTQFGFYNSYLKESKYLPYRPISGIKDISVEYKGGYKAIREATINWTIYSLEDLNDLTPHFLTIGKTILLDWGWISKKDPVIKNTFFNPNEEGKFMVDKLVFSNPMPKIIENRGNYDAIGGVISNFEYQLNDAGGFDCVTKIIGEGANLFESQPVDKGNTSLSTNNEGKKEIVKDGLVNGILNLDRIIIHDYFGVNLDPSVDSATLEKFQGAGEYDYVLTQLSAGTHNKDYQTLISHKGALGKFLAIVKTVDDGDKQQFIYGKEGSNDVYITKTTIKAEFDSDEESIDARSREDIFVRWGWFEDNILSRYSSFISESDTNTLVNEFRSIELDYGDDTNNKITEGEVYTGTEDQNTALLKAIGGTGPSLVDYLKSQKQDSSKDARKQLYEEYFGAPDKTSEKVDDNVKTFKKKSVRIRNHQDFLFPKDPLKFFLPGQNIRPQAINGLGIQIYDSEYWSKFLTLNNIEGLKFKDSNRPEYGILRNVMINTKEIRKAFGINLKDLIYTNEGLVLGSDKGIQPVATVKAGMMALCNAFSANFFNFWKFQIVEDPYLKIMKVIDENATYDLKSKLYTTYKNNSHRVQDLGIYKFPTWTLSSMVKNQGLAFKIPQAMAVSAMFGSNKDKTTGFALDLTDEGAEIEALFRDDKSDAFVDQRLGNLQKSYLYRAQDKKGHSIGSVKPNETSSPNKEIKVDGSFTINPESQWWSVFSPDHQSGANKNIAERADAEPTPATLSQSKLFESNFIQSKFLEEMEFIIQSEEGSFKENKSKQFYAAGKVNSEKIALITSDEFYASGKKDKEWLANKMVADLFTKKSGPLAPNAEVQAAEADPNFIGPQRPVETPLSGGSAAENKTTLAPDLSVPIKTFGNSYFFTNSNDGWDLSILPAGESIVQAKLFGNDIKSTAYMTNWIIPAELTLEIDGTSGITPGEIIQTDYIQPKYNMEIENGDGTKLGPFTFFQVFGITQKVDSSGWYTDLTTKMRINSDVLKLDAGQIERFIKGKDNKPVKDSYPGRDDDINPPPRPDDTKPPLPDPDSTDTDPKAPSGFRNRLQDPPPDPLPDDISPPLPDTDRDQVPPPPTRPIIPVPSDDEDIAGDLTLDELDFDDFSDLKGPPDPPEEPPIIDEAVIPKTIKGCTNPKAENYNPNANLDDGSCEFPEPPPPPPPVKKTKPRTPPVFIPKADPEIAVLKDVYTGSRAQNEVLYNIREDWRPIYRNSSGKLTGFEGKNKENTLLRSRVDFDIRKDFYHKYVEPKNTKGISKVGSSDGPRYTNTSWIGIADAYPDRLARKHVGGNSNPSVDKVYWKGKYMPKPGSTANPLIP